MIKNKHIELLSPAGDLERLKTAVRFGADAVYCGLPDFSLRNPREITFTKKTLKEGIKFAHENGVKIYLTFNIFPHERQIERLEKDIEGYYEILKDIDGVIVSDLGMFSLVKKYLPEVPIHVSTQANTLNSEAIKMWEKLGARRVVLARELTLKEIKSIRSTVENIKLEAFGHGAMCVAYSGRCLLSKYFTNREANLGDCAQSCRWKYNVNITEETRPDDPIEVQEDKNGTYFLNSKEICTLDILDKFIDAGIDALKIEGRAKSAYYVAMVTRIYRIAIDAVCTGKKIPKELFDELDLISNRGYSHGFLLGKDKYEQNYETTAIKPLIVFAGMVLGQNKNLIQVEIKNKFKVGEKVEIITPNEIYKTKIVKILNEKGKEIEEALTPQDKVWLEFKDYFEIPEGSILRKKTK